MAKPAAASRGRSQQLRDPDTFLPDRWLPGDPDAAVLRELYMPFSAGPRTCIGERLAEMEMRMILAPVLQRFDLLTPAKRPESSSATAYNSTWGAEGVRAELVVVLRPAGPGTMAQVRRRPSPAA